MSWQPVRGILALAATSLLLASIAILFSVGTSSAQPTPAVDVGTDGDDGYAVSAEEHRALDSGPQDPPLESPGVAAAPTAEEINQWLIGLRQCMVDARAATSAAGQSWDTSAARQTCEGTPEPADPATPAPQVTTDLVYTELQKVPLPSPQFVMQPGDRGLVNLPHIFYSTTPPPQPINLTLLGHAVTLTLTAKYEWHVAPDTSLVTDHPGAAYPNQTITHTYTDTGTVEVSLTMTYGGTFTVDGGAPQPIAGTVTMQSAPVSLQILSAHPELVAGPN